MERSKGLPKADAPAGNDQDGRCDCPLERTRGLECRDGASWAVKDARSMVQYTHNHTIDMRTLVFESRTHKNGLTLPPCDRSEPTFRHRSLHMRRLGCEEGRE